jgi:hypothetical protein
VFRNDGDDVTRGGDPGIIKQDHRIKSSGPWSRVVGDVEDRRTYLIAMDRDDIQIATEDGHGKGSITRKTKGTVFVSDGVISRARKNPAVLHLGITLIVEVIITSLLLRVHDEREISLEAMKGEALENSRIIGNIMGHEHRGRQGAKRHGSPSKGRRGRAERIDYQGLINPRGCHRKVENTSRVGR